MTPTNDAVLEQLTAATDSNVRTAGAWLALGAVVLTVGLVLHQPPSSDPAVFMAAIAADPVRWMVAHWAAALSVFMFAMAGLLVLTAGSRLTQTWWTATAWTALILSAVTVMTAALAEATAVTTVAVAGDATTFTTWQLFAEANAVAFVLLALAVAAIAVNEARPEADTTPSWAAWVATLAAIVAAGAYLAGVGFGVPLAGPVWLASTIVVNLWTLWFGVALARSEGLVSTRPVAVETGRQRSA